MILKPYLYKRKSNRPPVANLDRLSPVSVAADPIPLTGYVNGVKASDLEERFARALRSRRITFEHQKLFNTAATLPGQEKNVDFIVHSGLAYPVEIDGEIGHKTGEQLGEDQIRETLLNEVFAQQGYQPMQRIKWWQMETQVDTDLIVRQMFP